MTADGGAARAVPPAAGGPSLREVHQRMLEAVLGGGGLGEVAELAAAAAGAPVAIVVPRLDAAVSSPGARADLAALRRYVLERSRGRPVPVPAGVAGEAAIQSGGDVIGGVLLLGEAVPEAGEFLQIAALAALTEVAVQGGRAEAERTTAMVSGMQLLVDAALRHRSLGDILDDLVVRVRAVLDADAATIFLAEEQDRLVIAASSGGPEVEEQPVPIRFGEYFAGRVALSQEAQLAHNPDPADLADPSMRALEIDSLIGVPLTAEGEIAGVLTVCATAPHHFREEDLGLLRLAADRVALAISHARVYEREHRIAVTLQRSLLPEKLPTLPGLDVDARYLPAAAEAEVGGDWYDVIPLARGGVGLVMGDVAGKGLAAASMVGQLRSALRAYALENHNPATVVEQLNRLVWAEADDSQMATLLYAVVDPADSAVRWVNAGHPAPLLVAGEAEPRFLEGGSSVPLGVLPFPTYREVSAPMDPGSTIVLYTDGLVERPGEHIDEGMARLAASVGAAPREPEPLLDHLESALVPAGAPDDIALLALRNLPISDRFSAEFPTQPESLARMRELLRRWLGHADASPHETAEITTACGEAATNAIEHAGVGGPFDISGVLVGREVEITVQDYGEWRAAREGDQGRGLALMRALMDTVEVTPTPEGTTVRLRRALNG